MRRLAREALSERWGIGFAAELILHLAVTTVYLVLLHTLGEIAGLYSLLVGGPFLIGNLMFYMALFRNREPHIEQVFYGFHRFGRSLGLYLYFLLRISLWGLIAGGPMLIFFFAYEAGSGFLAFIALTLTIAAMIPAVLAALRYSQSFFLLIDYPDMGIVECVRVSSQMMRGNKMKYFLLLLSFIGWGALAGIPLGIIEAAFPVTASTSIFGVIMLSIIPYLAIILVLVYQTTAAVAFYDLVKGNLRPGVINTTAEIMSPEQAAEQHQTGDIAIEPVSDEQNIESSENEIEVAVAQNSEQTNELQKEH